MAALEEEARREPAHVRHHHRHHRTTTSTTGACDLRGSAGDDDILFTVEHERHRRSCLRQSRFQIEKLFTSVGAIRQETVVHA